MEKHPKTFIKPQNYNQTIADNVKNIYKQLDEYTFQTTRSDRITEDIKGKIFKIKAKIEFKSYMNMARVKITELDKVVKSTNDTFLSNVVSKIRADWPQFHL